MLSPLRNRFGIPGVISVIALVFAMLGGAYAASNDGGSGSATASAKKNKKAKKGPRGPRGKTGPAGPAGPAGPQGPAGAAGAKGDKGDSGANGTNGTNGANGASVEVEGASEEECPNGGSRFKVAGVTKGKACNGEKGTFGTGTLPSEETLTGAWAYGKTPAAGTANLAISFPIPLAEPLGGNEVHYINPAGKEVTGFDFEAEEPEPIEVDSTECLGDVSEPAANPGHLCVYAANVVPAPPSTLIHNAVIQDPSLAITGFEGSAGTMGAWMRVATSNGDAHGTWAVTAP